MAENVQNSPGQLPTTPPITPPKPTQPQIQQKPLQQQQKPLFRRAVGEKPKKGDLIGFRYMFWKHDPHPLVLVTSQYNDGRVAGVNLHNLTLWDMKNLVSQYCNKGNISYQTAVKGKREIVKGFRTYRWNGIKDMTVIDCNNFLGRMGIVREKRLLSPNEVEKLRLQVQQQLKRQINPKAQDMNKYQQQQKTGSNTSIPGTPASKPGIPVGQQGGE